MNSWIYLIIAGICEILWAVPLKFSEGFTKTSSISNNCSISNIKHDFLGTSY